MDSMKRQNDRTLQDKLPSLVGGDHLLMGRAMLSKSLIQFSVDGWGYVPSLLFDLRPNCGGGNEDNGTSFRGPMGALLH